ncbi:hypothetical protein QQM39_15050 [Streptomyces sp. DT2A-34]|uniref:hypothetical protein n=1 Tax=Streptomyces sp. DT2A-34 TaxID=3051182 RepID=UPI00265C28BF|nr:hypothetical protein [Streptomyces sp. DT2A-34]MDO0912114.1 hypothetical protein [Streptomyces sp. DT2A-34]
MSDQGTAPPWADDRPELAALVVAGGFWRLRMEPAETWLNQWAPYPVGVRRGPYAVPTRANLKATLAGLERLLPVIRSEETTSAPAVPMPDLESVAVAVGGCVTCKAAHSGRTSAHARGADRTAREFNRIIGQHPHRRTGEGVKE